MAAYLGLLRALVLGLVVARCAGDDRATNETPTDPFDVIAPVEAPPGPNDVVFTPQGGGFTGQQSVTLSTSGGAAIHYTLDGSVPSEASPPYQGPIEFEDTTLVRAVSIVDGLVVDTFAQTYVALDSNAASFSSNLPIVVIERHGAPQIETDSDELVASSLLSFEPMSTGRAALLGEARLSSRAGVRVRGQSSRAFAQKSYAVELWLGGSDDDRKASWLGMPSESDWTLIAPSQMDRSLMRTMMPMDLSRAIGSYAPRTRFVEVFLVDREGSDALSMDDYVGVYTAAEKIKRDENRVNVATLAVTDDSEPAISGGYLFRIDHGEPNFDVAGYGFQWDYPDADTMDDPARAPQREYLTGYLDEFLRSIQGDDSERPYSDYIDTAKWIDHNLLVALTKNVDGLRLSAFFYKDRQGPLVAGPVWDFDRSSGTPHDDRARGPEEWSSGDGTHPLTELFWGELFEQPDFRDAYWARWDELSQSEFSVPALLARIDGYEAELGEARERHFERFRELPPEDGAEGEVEILREFYRARVPWISSQRP